MSWPKGFIYTPNSISEDIHPNLLDHIFTSKDPKDCDVICPCIEEKRVHRDIQIRKITKNMKCKGSKPHPLANLDQYGVFAKKNIDSHTVLGEYVGQWFMGKKTVQREGTYSWTLSINGCELFLYSGIYANETTFINDFRSLADQSNCVADWVVHRGKYYFCYISSKKILKGEEILVDYGVSWAQLFMLNQIKKVFYAQIQLEKSKIGS